MNEQTYRTWEPYLLKIQESYPALLKLSTPKGVRQSTFEVRLREARRAAKGFETKLDHEVLALIHFRRFSKNVLAGTSEAIRAFLHSRKKGATPQVEEVASMSPNIAVFPVGRIDASAFNILLLLAHERMLTRPVKLEISPLVSLDGVANLDVCLQRQGDGSYILT